ncbi:MAG: hypothetical protein HXX08_14640 [Chloroflexi bacterium]|uniref:ATP-binding protein n=1 Tax=Candidatus Chlorohelix allophototropha TaxID=3003348 RepID=A0A8T7M4R5_9CHLR|nr:hypothetical protein [Chloroflexota bacterium]WJW70257.1 hypothetical protein OZ401_004986 [Chloroflexota bacterium L227-S17]
MDEQPKTHFLVGLEEDHRLIQNLFRIPDRYLRSIHIERDFHDVELLEQYILTPSMERSLIRITEGLRPNSGRRAWRITGDYGSGKSSFALLLAHVLYNPEKPAVTPARLAIENANSKLLNLKLIPVIVTGAREGLVSAIARGILWSLDCLLSQNDIRDLLKERAKRLQNSGDNQELLELIRDLANIPGYSGVLLVLDEMGKLLEYAALYPDREDVYLLQRLAEMAARSGNHPVVLVGLLHQGFHAYAERLPSAVRHEWEKVAGRFDEIVFDQPLTHTVTLVSSALNVITEQLPQEIIHNAETIIKSTLSTGWYSTAGNTLSELNLLKLYPLHPTVIPVLINFFSRFGQHERSLFGFLLSTEPYGLQAFAERPIKAGGYYRLSNFYDYIRANFGHRLDGASFRSQWLRIVDILDSADINDEVALAILKTVAVLNLIDSEQYLATDVALLSATVDNDPTYKVETAIAKLKDRGLLFKRGTAGGYRLWSTTSINLETRFEDAKRALGPIEQVAIHLPNYLDVPVPTLLARRHYIKTGTMRYFEVRYTDFTSLSKDAIRPTAADGLVVVALCDTPSEQIKAREFAQGSEAASRPEILIAVPFPLIGLRNEVQDVRCWEWVKSNAPELTDDIYASAEVSREIAATRRTLRNRLTALISFGHADTGMEIEWWRKGQPLSIEQGHGILLTLSAVCDELYNDAPYIKNELLNRSILSSAAANARMRLIERMLEAPNKPFLGINQDKAPPEKSMYLSVLKAGVIHRELDGQYIIEEPEEENDTLQLRPALLKILNILEEAQEQRVSVPTIITALTSRPFGIRMGVIPLLLAIVVAGHSHELAVYENGTFITGLNPSNFLRLIKAPATFEFQMVRVAGVRVRLFNRLARIFVDSPDKDLELLDVVRSFINFAAELPEYTRRTVNLPTIASRVREVLFKAREPRPLLFKELPEACGVESFSAEETPDTERIEKFVTLLQQALNDLRNTYPLLLERIRSKVANALGEGEGAIDRERIASRATNVAVAASESRLRTFALRLGDTRLNSDSWAEALGSFVIAKPTRNWLPGDEKKAGEEIEILCNTFQRLEAITFSQHNYTTSGPAVRVGLTHSNGMEAMQVVQVRPEIELEVKNKVSELQGLLPESEELRLAILVQLLEQSLNKKDKSDVVPQGGGA